MSTAESEMNISILILRERTRHLISALLNPHKFIRTEHGLPRDWQGLADLCGISGELIPNILREQDPTAKVLKLWADEAKSEATIEKLIQHLEELKRCDIVDDALPFIAEDIKFHNEHKSNDKTVNKFDLQADKYILTRDDVARINEGLEPQFYDAFVLFADDDIDFATELIENMEKNYNLKFCVKERDLVVGGSEHEAVIKLIAERCGRLIVIISPAFLESTANKFFYSLAQSIGIEQGQRKVIPCIYKECGILPPELSCYSRLDFRRVYPFGNFWDKLHDSIKLPNYKPKGKLSLPENSLFKNADMTPQLKVGNGVSRSVSNPNQLLSPNDLKPALHNQSSHRSTISHSVRFSSMSNLPDAEVPEELMVPSTSANSLGNYEEKGVRKTLSFYKKIKNLGSIFPKSKSKLKGEKEDPDQQDVCKKEDKGNGNILINKKSGKNKSGQVKSNEQNDKQSEKTNVIKEKKKNIFTLKRKKKAVLAT